MIEVKSDVYKFEIDEIVYDVITGEKLMITLLRTLTDKDRRNGKDRYYTVNEYYVYGDKGYAWLGEALLTTKVNYDSN